MMGTPPIKRFKFDHGESIFGDVLNLSKTTNENEDIAEMRQKFQAWVTETYKDSSKTKTITRRKYERIVKTMAGEIKNCAENSKFRFWMKCKGFKLETESNGFKILVVQDKGAELKYKKVAVVENFFDIIYKVHVNEGARGVQHAGQKRTHRTITETYAFLPREAVTKFLMFCSECQKRNYEERKCSPNSSSNDSLNDQWPKIADKGLLFNSFSCSSAIDNKELESRAYVDSSELCASIQMPTATENIPSETNRRRKMKFIRKIVRPKIAPDEKQQRNTIPKYEHTFPSDDHQSPLNLVQRITSDPNPKHRQQDTKNQPESKVSVPPEIIVQNCPYITRLSQILHNPGQYAEEYLDTQGMSYLPVDHDIMEQLAVNLVAKIGQIKDAKTTLTEDEKYHLCLKVHSCRISSFLLNYAADLILRSVVSN